jgi:hypothetical protein
MSEQDTSVTIHHYDDFEIAGERTHGNDFELDKLIDLLSKRVVTPKLKFNKKVYM